jgi:trimethylamine:corrinoid methyltransferase-like protein
VVERAREKVREILSSHKPPELESDLRRRIHEVVEEGEKGIPH